MRQSHREVASSERKSSGDLHSVSLESATNYWSVHMLGKLSCQRKYYQKGAGGTILEITDWRIMHVPTTQSGKTPRHLKQSTRAIEKSLGSAMIRAAKLAGRRPPGDLDDLSECLRIFNVFLN